MNKNQKRSIECNRRKFQTNNLINPYNLQRNEKDIAYSKQEQKATKKQHLLNKNKFLEVGGHSRNKHFN